MGKYHPIPSVGMSAVWELCASATQVDIVHLVLRRAQIISRGKKCHNQKTPKSHLNLIFESSLKLLHITDSVFNLHV